MRANIFILFTLFLFAAIARCEETIIPSVVISDLPDTVNHTRTTWVILNRQDTLGLFTVPHTQVHVGDTVFCYHTYEPNELVYFVSHIFWDDEEIYTTDEFPYELQISDLDEGKHLLGYGFRVYYPTTGVWSALGRLEGEIKVLAGPNDKKD